MLLVVFPSAASGFCNWGPNGDAVSSTCEGGAQGGDWCNANEDQCRNGCGGNWCGSGGGGSGGGGGGSGFCNWGPNGDAASSTCQGGAQGGDWCNANSGQCEDGCGGRWCTGGDPAPPPPPPPTGDGACGPGWNEARWTTYTSYADCCENSPTYNPSADTSECSGFNACEWLGKFAYLGKKSFNWVKSNNIISFYSYAEGSGDSYANKKMRVKSGGKTLEVTVADTCGDSDCGGCCSTNAAETGYLVDMEYWTVMNNFGTLTDKAGYITYIIGVAAWVLAWSLIHCTRVYSLNSFIFFIFS